MKALIADVFHRMESITDWTPMGGVIAIDSTQRVEGKYSIKLTSDAGGMSGLVYTKTVDWSKLERVYFWVYHPGAVAEEGALKLFTDVLNTGVWFFTFTDTWTKISVDLDSPDIEVGTLDLSNITMLRLSEEENEDPGEDYYFDYIYSLVDVEPYLPLDCYIDSPTWNNRSSVFKARITPKYESYFQRGDILYIQDDSDNSVFYGTIKTPRRLPTRIELTAISEGFELVNKDTVFSDTSATTTSYLKQIIGNATKSQEGSLQNTTIEYTYDVKKNYTTMIDHCRYTERGVFYREPGYDGDCYWNKDITDVNSLVDTGETWTKDTSGMKFMDKRPYDIGITRVHIWGGNNSLGQVNYLATATSAENERGEFGIYRYSDFGLMNYTETKQLADNMLAIFKKDTTYYDFQARGKGFLQWGKRVNAKWNMKSILTTADDFMIVQYRYYPKIDTYRPITLSDNIVFEDELKSIRKQLNRDDIINAEFINSGAPVSTVDGTVIPGARHDRSVWNPEDAGAYHFVEGGGNTDFSTIGDVAGTWYDLDLSSKIPVGTTEVEVFVSIEDEVKNSKFYLRKNGQSNGKQICRFNTQNGDTPFDNGGGTRVGVDSNRKIEFRCIPKASEFTTIVLHILGWQI